MKITDPIADYLTRVRNAIKARHRVVEVPASSLKKEMTKVLFDKGYILNYKFEDTDNKQGKIKIVFQCNLDFALLVIGIFKFVIEDIPFFEKDLFHFFFYVGSRHLYHTLASLYCVSNPRQHI